MEVEANRLNLYALVIYLPDPLRSFLDKLRLELAPACNPHAHVSVLPPRRLQVPDEQALQQGRETLAGFPPFNIELGGIEMFPVTDVIYISVDGGTEQLRSMHRALNRDHFHSEEPFSYHPHVTLAQELDPAVVREAGDLAARRWGEFRNARGFRAEKAVFVQNVSDNHWMDLETIPFGGVPVQR